jgi:hypothetical protein
MMYPTIGIYPLFAASSWPFAVLLAAPVFAVLLVLAYSSARTSWQRLANLLFGLIGSVTVMAFALWYLCDISGIPPLTQDDYIPVVAPASMAVGAAMGVAVSALVRKSLAMLVCRRRRSSSEHPSN